MYQPRVECGPHCPSRPVVSSEKREIFAAPPKMHQQPEHPGQRAGQAGAGRGGASGMQAGACEAGPGPRSPPPLKDPGLHPAETTSCSPSPAREAPEAPSICSTASKHLLSKPSMIFTPMCQTQPPRVRGSQVLRPDAQAAPGTGEAPSLSQGQRSCKRADFVCSLCSLFYPLVTRIGFAT